MTKKIIVSDPLTKESLEQVVSWLRRQADFPMEAMAGFVHHVGTDCWDTADHWRTRWDQWFHGTGQ